MVVKQLIAEESLAGREERGVQLGFLLLGHAFTTEVPPEKRADRGKILWNGCLLRG